MAETLKRPAGGDRSEAVGGPQVTTQWEAEAQEKGEARCNAPTHYFADAEAAWCECGEVNREGEPRPDATRGECADEEWLRAQQVPESWTPAKTRRVLARWWMAAEQERCRAEKAEARATTAERRLEEAQRECGEMLRAAVEGAAEEHERQLTASQQEAREQTAWRCFFCDEVFTDAVAARRHFDPSGVGGARSNAQCLRDACDAQIRAVQQQFTASQQEVARLRNLARRVLDTASSPLSSEHVAAKEVLSATLSSPHQSTGQGA